MLLRKAERRAADAVKPGFPLLLCRRARYRHHVMLPRPCRPSRSSCAPVTKVTAAVVKARKTSMIATVPVARVAPSRRLWIEISIAMDRSRPTQTVAGAPFALLNCVHLSVLLTVVSEDCFGRENREHSGQGRCARLASCPYQLHWRPSTPVTDRADRSAWSTRDLFEA